MLTNVTLLLIFVALTSVAGQTFQYSRGWTNGKRAHKDKEDMSPCQLLNKLRNVLEGRPVNERTFAPCDYVEDDEQNQSQRRYKNERSSDLYDAFQ